MAGSAGKVRVNENRAKQGLRGLHVLWVLAISTTLAAMALAAAWWWRSGDLSAVRGSTAAPPGAESHFSEAPQAARQAPDVTPAPDGTEPRGR